jgi:AP2-associated kinase
MCDHYSKYKVNEKVDIWMLGCILYTLIYKKHPFADAQKLAIINAHYFTPDTSYNEKLLDFMRLLLTPNPEKRPDIRKVIQIIQNWDNINKIELSVFLLI